MCTTRRLCSSAVALSFALLCTCFAGAGESASWTESERRILASLALPDPVVAPASPSNRVADRAEAIELGRKIFFDRRFSANGEVSCATCHQVDKKFTDGLRVSRGIGTTLRNSPTLIGSAFGSWFYWDGRRDSLWSQALIPLEAPDEMGGSRVAVLRRIGSDPSYRSSYENLFGAPPPSVDRIPGEASPFGDKEARARWHAAPAALRTQVDTAFANVGKALEAYERTLLPTESPFDRYVRTLIAEGEEAAQQILSADAIAGARLFIDERRTRCLRCHNGPNFTHGGFQNIGTGNFTGQRLDFGRVFGIRAVRLDPFNCLGKFSDAGPEDCAELRFMNEEAHVPLDGAFKVPGLRNVFETAPYMHDGSLPSLPAVLQHYRTPPAGSGPPHELQPLDLDDREIGHLIEFLKSLSSK